MTRNVCLLLFIAVKFINTFESNKFGNGPIIVRQLRHIFLKNLALLNELKCKILRNNVIVKNNYLHGRYAYNGCTI